MRDNPLWFQILCCPVCQGDFRLSGNTNPAEDGHILDGKLVCQSCQASYPIVGGIPRFVDVLHDESVRDTVEGFAFEWKAANPFIQKTKFSGAELFLDFIEPVAGDYFRDKVVLDAGCGLGRDVILSQAFGASAIVGVDLSSVVDVAFANTRALPNVLIIQADLLKLPLRSHFDYIYSIGVLHHTVNPQQTFAAVSKCVKLGGGLSVWVYGRENNGWIINVLDPIRKHVTRRLPHMLLWVLSYMITLPMYLAIHLVYLPISRSDRLKSLSRYLFYYDYLVWLGKYCGFRAQALVVFDQLVPTLAEYIAKPELQAWFAENGLHKVIITSRANNSWRGFGIRLDSPQDPERVSSLYQTAAKRVNGQ